MNKFNTFGNNYNAYQSPFINDIFASLKFWLFYDINNQTNKCVEELNGWKKRFADNEPVLSHIEKMEERLNRDKDVNKFISKKSGLKFCSRRK